MPHYCFSSHYFHPHVGGVERYVEGLAAELVIRGHRCTVLTSALEGQPTQDVYRGISVIRLPSHLLLDGRFPLPKVRTNLASLLLGVKATAPDFMVLNTRFFPISMLASICARIWGIPSVLVEHGTGHFEMRSPILTKAAHVYEHLITLLINRFVSNFYGVSRASCRWLAHFGIKAKGTLPNSVALSLDRNSVPREQARLMFGFGDESYVVAFAGRLIPEKGLRELLEAARLLHAGGVPITVAIAGNGPLREEVAAEAQSGSSVRYVGELPRDRVLHLLHASDAFILPSKYPEGLPTSILEAGASLCPVIASDVGGTSEVIEHGRSGTLLIDVSPTTIAGAVRYLYGTRVQALLMAKELYRRIEIGYSWEQTATRLEALTNNAK